MAKGWLIGGGVFLAVLLVASIVVTLVQQVEDLPEGTPGATVQNFFEAAEAEDYQLVYSFLSQEIKDDCDVEDFVGSQSGFGNRLENGRITLEDTNFVDDFAFVNVRIAQIRVDGVFGTSESHFEQQYTLKMEEGEWRFSQNPWPFFCNRFKPPVAPTPVEPVTPTPEPEPKATPNPTP